jgi:hypothetical protein
MVESNKECLPAAKFPANPRAGEMKDGFHGDPDRGHKFWVYKPNQPAENLPNI